MFCFIVNNINMIDGDQLQNKGRERERMNIAILTNKKKPFSIFYSCFMFFLGIISVGA